MCLGRSTEADNVFVYCDTLDCALCVHQACYGVKTLPSESEPWLCDRCKAPPEEVVVRIPIFPLQATTDNVRFSSISTQKKKLRFPDTSVLTDVFLLLFLSLLLFLVVRVLPVQRWCFPTIGPRRPKWRMGSRCVCSLATRDNTGRSRQRGQDLCP